LIKPKEELGDSVTAFKKIDLDKILPFAAQVWPFEVVPTLMWFKILEKWCGNNLELFQLMETCGHWATNIYK